MMRLLLCAMLALLTSCAMFSERDRNVMRDTIEQEYQQGNLTTAQRDAALEALERDGAIDWEALGFAGLNIGLALLGAPMIVRMQRGRPTQKVGLPASKVHAEGA